MAVPDGGRHLGNLYSQQFTAGGRELFGVVDAPNARLHGQAHRTHRQGTGHRPSSDLVNAHDNAVAAQLVHQLVHAIDALAFGEFLGMTLHGALAGLDDLLAWVLAIMLDQGGNLLKRGTRQLAGNLRRRNRACHVGHTGASLHANQ